jgi:hypothetical protein
MLKSRYVSALCLLVFLAVPVTAQISYPTSCNATGEGLIKTSATIATPLLVDHDFRSTDMAASFPIASASNLYIFDLKDSYAEVFRTGFGGGGCVSDIASSIAGQTTYEFIGDSSTMQVQVDSLTSESASITRNNVTGTGVAITASNSYEVPQATQLNVEIPFTVSGANRSLKVTQFAFSRTDTTSTTGSTVGAYQVFADNNSNCTVDTGDTSSIGSAGIVFPNGTYSEPATKHNIAAGNYVLVISYFTDVDLAAFSADCSTSVNFGGWTADGFDLNLTIQ